MTREEFLQWARQEVVTPRAAEGHEPFSEGYYWAVLVSKGTYFAVDALANGKLRVHLYTSNDDIKRSWKARTATARPVPVSHNWTSPGMTNKGRQKRDYFRFEWIVSSSDYSREKNLVLQTAGWLDQFWSTE